MMNQIPSKPEQQDVYRVEKETSQHMESSAVLKTPKAGVTVFSNRLWLSWACVK